MGAGSEGAVGRDLLAGSCEEWCATSFLIWAINAGPRARTLSRRGAGIFFGIGLQDGSRDFPGTTPCCAAAASRSSCTPRAH